MKEKLILVAAVIVAITATLVWRGAAGDQIPAIVPAIAAGVIVLGAGIGAAIVRRRRESQDLSNETDSLERQLALDTQAKTFIDGVIVGTILGCALLIWDFVAAPFAVLALVVFCILDFFIRFGIAKARAGSSR